jgi:riboflavin synthase
MFTGLVHEVGTVTSASARDGGAELGVSASMAASLERGDSVLVNGICLTATRTSSDTFAADLSPETLRRSSLGELEVGHRVNLELPLRPQDRLGGHIVQGHVDAVAEIRTIEDEGSARNLWVEAPPPVMRYVVEKGSVALDGVSLTVTAVEDHGFGVSLIPETLDRTNLGDVLPGHRINLEVDVMAKYVEKLLSRQGRLDPEAQM